MDVSLMAALVGVPDLGLPGYWAWWDRHRPAKIMIIHAHDQWYGHSPVL